MFYKTVHNLIKSKNVFFLKLFSSTVFLWDVSYGLFLPLNNDFVFSYFYFVCQNTSFKNNILEARLNHSSVDCYSVECSN